MPEVWDFVCKNYPSIEYYYLAEEVGMGYYVNSDTTGEYFPEKYYVYHEEGYSEYLNDDEELLEYVAEKIGTDKIESIDQMNQLLEQYNEKHPDEEIYYHEFIQPEQ